MGGLPLHKRFQPTVANEAAGGLFMLKTHDFPFLNSFYHAMGFQSLEKE